MIGMSWGGFNKLQVAARRPPESKAVISICSTDDHYADDIHYMGGLLACRKFLMACYYVLHERSATRPGPRPATNGEIFGWSDERLEVLTW